jgi:hypothetical protein
VSGSTCVVVSVPYDKSKKKGSWMMLTSELRTATTRRKLEDLRVVEFVGHFSLEALLATDGRTSLTLDARRNSALCCCKFDGRVLTLKKACLAIRKGNPTDVDIIDRRIEAEREKVEKEALDGWNIFKEKLAVKLGNDYDVNAVEEAVRLLLQGPQDSYTIIDLLSRKSGDAAAD